VDDQVENVVEYNRRGAITNASVGSGSGGGGVDDIFKRLGNVETGVSELRSEVSAISATISHLATATSVSDVRTEIAGVRTEIADVKTQIASKETAMIKWIIATVLTTAGLAFSIAKFVH